MRPEDDNIAGLLKSFLPSAQRTELARDRLLQRLGSQSASREEGSTETEEATARWSGRLGQAVVIAAVAVLVLIVFMRMRSLLNSGHEVSVYAVVELADGGLFRTPSGQALQNGNRIEAGDTVRTAGGIGTVLALADGSRIEMRPQSSLSLEQANEGVRIRLDTGGIIVSAARQRAGHLYVQTKDVIVSVVGTVFLVNTEEAGSRVAVIQGEVYVQQGTTAKKLLPGQQVATNPLMESHPVIEQFSWSREAETHVATLQQSAVVESTQSTPVAKRLEFEAASFRALEPGAFPGGFVGCKGVDGIWSYNRDVEGFGGPADPPSVPQGRCFGSGDVKRFVAAAYGIPVSRVLSNEKELWLYRLDAKAENTESATTGRLREMLQNLMIDRFKLKAHRYTEEKPGYFLVVAKGGPKFKETSGDEELPRPLVGPFGQGSLPYLIKGKFRLKNFAQYLSSASVANNGRPIVDKTELSGLYDINLILHQTPPVGVRGGGGGITSEMWDPPLADALEDQLGLRLESAAKVPLEYLFIDHIERPSEN